MKRALGYLRCIYDNKTFNSFEDETIENEENGQVWKYYLSIPLRMKPKSLTLNELSALLAFNSFEDETWIPHGMRRQEESLTFNSFEDETMEVYRATIEVN